MSDLLQRHPNSLQLRYPDKPNRTDQAYKATPRLTNDAKSDKETQ